MIDSENFHRVVIDRDDLPPIKRSSGLLTVWEKAWRWRCLDCDRKQPWTPRKHKAVRYGNQHGVIVRNVEAWR